ncbi:GPI ethanolamine phosphate transferase [Phytophthora palmivora]|uniref:GPI ethanolamine phosphate transferase 1 n=1 Tax=Phytophthora palmivora TaxID=4796 RepID=A0A2P4Y3Y0_9STRA|nr:GPI ethanolamine phosphate transferase [Phytophthora palmivora]
MSGGKKRPRADLLSSLDAAFASTAQPAASKYTAQAAAQAAPKGNKQQAYQHSKKKRKDKKRNARGNDKETTRKEAGKEEKKEVKVDPLYEKVDAELLAIGLKDCSLQPQAKMLAKPRALHETFKNYLESVTQGTRAGSNSIDSLKNKVLSLDNPFKTTAAETTEKTIAAASRKQTAKLLSARRRRELGLHMLNGEMKYSDAEQLNDIWIRYVSQMIESELSEVQSVTEEAQRTRNTKLQAKLKYLDLSGCPLEVIRSQNPCNVGLNGIVVAETQQTLQICCPASAGNNSDGTIRIGHFVSISKEHMGSIARLLLLGVVFHALCIVSIFDIYFQSPVESSIHSSSYTSSPPAKRVIIFTLDGCRVDKLFKVVAHYTDHYDLQPDSNAADSPFSSDTRVPFLGDVMRNRGSWGVSHNHAPTESRPCHVALTAGMYEDPHAVSKNWKQHPVPFDSVFNQSNNAFIFGNKDVAPILARHAPQATEEHYTAKEEVEMRNGSERS